MMNVAKIKTAFILSGIQRFPENAFATIMSFEKFCDIFTFAHTWEYSENLKTYCYSKNPFELTHTPQYWLAKLPRITYHIENNDIIKSNFDGLFNQIQDRSWKYNSSHFSMFYSIKQADLLRRQFETDHNIIFDCVFRLRFDSIIRTPFNPRNYNLECLNVPVDHQYAFDKPQPGKQRGINDQFAWGNSEIMTQYCDTYDHIVEICNNGCVFCPHAILGQHLINKKLKVERPEILVNINSR